MRLLQTPGRSAFKTLESLNRRAGLGPLPLRYALHDRLPLRALLPGSNNLENPKRKKKHPALVRVASLAAADTILPID